MRIFAYIPFNDIFIQCISNPTSFDNDFLPEKYFSIMMMMDCNIYEDEMATLNYVHLLIMDCRMIQGVIHMHFHHYKLDAHLSIETHSLFL